LRIIQFPFLFGLGKGTLNGVMSMCVLEKGDVLYMMCGHLSGCYSYWQIPISQLTLNIGDHDEFEFIPHKSIVIEKVDSKWLKDNAKIMFN